MLNNTFTAFFLDTTTAPGTPLTGLSATISIIDLSSNAVVVNNVAMVEVGLGNYKFTYGQYEPTKDYAWQCNPNSALAYISSGSTELPTGARGGSGIGGVSTEQIKSLEKSFESKLSQIWERINTPTDLSEIKSHIDIAKDQVITTIEAIEIPEHNLDEKEAKKAIKLLTTLDKKVSGYIDTEMADKEELGAIAKQFSKLEMEDAMKEKQKDMEHKKMMEEEKKKEEEEDKKLLEEIKLEFSKADEKEKNEKRKELEKELEETLKEAEEIKKELKTI